MSGRASRLAALLALGAACAAPPTDLGWRYLHVIPTQAAAGLDLDLERGLRVALAVEAPEQLAARLAPEAVEAVERHRVVLRLDRYPGRLDGDPEAYRAASFVVDYDSDAVEAWARQIAPEPASVPTPEGLVEAVRAIVSPGGGRGFAFASRIARERRGDCTEHAVLFAALARRFGYPTRVMLGSVLAEVEGQVSSYGHAWNEVYEAGAWRAIDATPVAGGRPLAYVPDGHLEDEGPGYALYVLSRTRRSPERVTILGNVP